MKITKSMQFNGSHIVRNCSSTRCKYSIHGHTYLVEIELSGTSLDSGGMIVDFGLVKESMKTFIKSFNNSVTVWDRDIQFKEFALSKIDRVITIPVTPSAEYYSVLILYVLDKILKATSFANNEDQNVIVSSVTVHETRTGKAKSHQEDLSIFKECILKDIKFTQTIKDSWDDPEFWDKLVTYTNANAISNLTEQDKPFKNSTPIQQC